jgi:hypothetical protein
MMFGFRRTTTKLLAATMIGSLSNLSGVAPEAAAWLPVPEAEEIRNVDFGVNALESEFSTTFP